MTTKPSVPTAKEAVDTLLGLSQLPMITEEYERLVRTYPLIREQIDALRIPEVRYGEPAIIYPVLEHL